MEFLSDRGEDCRGSEERSDDEAIAPGSRFAIQAKLALAELKGGAALSEPAQQFDDPSHQITQCECVLL